MSLEHLRARDAQVAAADAEYRRWFASLPSKEKDKLRALKLDKPATDSQQVSGRSAPRDPTPDRASTAAFDPSDLDSHADQLAQRFDLDDHTAQELATHFFQRLQADRKSRQSNLLQSIIGLLLRAENIKTSAAGLAYASGLAVVNNFGSIHDYAKRSGLSPAAISKQQKKWRETLGLKPSIHAKPPAACAAFSKAQKSSHWRNAKFTTQK